MTAITDATEMLKNSFQTILRPLFLLIGGLLIYNVSTVVYKIQLTIKGASYLLFCNDKSWKKPTDPSIVFESAIKEGKVEKKTIVFIRHGESTWNETFNKGSHRSFIVFVIGYIPNMIKALLYECNLILTGKIDSWFYDSPLSHLGLGQANALGNFLAQKPSEGSTKEEKEMLSILRGEPGSPPSKIVCSNLRRAVSTIAAGFRERLSRRPTDTIVIVPSLQEISRNPDALAITPPYTAITASWIEKESTIADFQQIYAKQCDVTLHDGNKPVNSNGLIRMLQFNKYAFEQEEEVLICGGHSIWFRSFFKTFLPYSNDHVSKTRKIVNGGTVSFSLMKMETEDGPVYMIDSNSILVVYGGF